MATFRQFDRYILPFMSNPPLPAVDDALRDSAIEFCDRTRVLNEVTERLPVSAGTGDIDIDSPDSELVIAQVISVYTPTGKLTPKTKRELEEIFPTGWPFASVDSAELLKYWLSTVRSTIRLVPYPTFSAPEIIAAAVAYKPSREAASLPDELYEHYAEAIAAGAMARLHAHPHASYADAARIAAYRGLYDSAIYMTVDEHLSGVGKPQLRTGQDEFQ